MKEEYTHDRKARSASRRLYFLFSRASWLRHDLYDCRRIAPSAHSGLSLVLRGNGHRACGKRAGYLLSAFLSGLIVQRIPAKVVIVVGLVAGAAGVSLFGRGPSPGPISSSLFAMGLCQGSMEVVANLEIIHIEQNGQSRLMNLLHAAFSVGAIAGPAAVGSSRVQARRCSSFFLQREFSSSSSGPFRDRAFPRGEPDERTGERARAASRPRTRPRLLTFLLLRMSGSKSGSLRGHGVFVQVLGSAASQGHMRLPWSGWACSSGGSPSPSGTRAGGRKSADARAVRCSLPPCSSSSCSSTPRSRW